MRASTRMCLERIATMSISTAATTVRSTSSACQRLTTSGCTTARPTEKNSIVRRMARRYATRFRDLRATLNGANGLRLHSPIGRAYSGQILGMPTFAKPFARRGAPRAKKPASGTGRRRCGAISTRSRGRSKGASVPQRGRATMAFATGRRQISRAEFACARRSTPRRCELRWTKRVRCAALRDFSIATDPSFVDSPT